MNGQRGLTLVELLVSVTILALATTVALVVYDQARLAYKHGENVTEQQHVARVAFDVITSDIRMAGFNTNPDGNRTRHDEQIEAAYATAITLRADFDANEPLKVDDFEQALAGPGAAFLAVSTGNDEIRTYVLAKADGSSSGSLTFGADVGAAVRDATIEDITIGEVDLTQTDPPYTLYRLILDDDPGLCCGTNFATRVPIVGNVRALRFRYFDRAGNELTPPGGAETTAAIDTRAAIRRVAVEIEALTRDSDPHWFDPDDTDPDTQRFKKFLLEGEVVPPNLGRGAIKDLQADATPPTAPTSPWLYPGHCGGLFIAWPPNPPQDDVAYYRVEYGTNPAALDGVRSAATPGLFVGGLTDGVQYHVAVQAVDPSGNRSPFSPIAQVSTTNTNTPAAALALSALGGTGKIDLAWSATTENTGSTSGDPVSPLIRDLDGYNVYRSLSAAFTPSGANRIADADDAPNLPNPVYSDATVPHCKRHYYKVAAVDDCGVEGAFSNEVWEESSTAVEPLPPDDVQAFASNPTTQVRVVWSPVREDVNGDPVYIDTYKIYRSPLQPANIDDPASWSEIDQVTNGATEYLDSITIPAGQTAHYLIEAVDSCAPPNESILSDSTNPICNFSGDVVITQPAYGATVWGDTLVQVDVVGADPSAVNDRARLRFVDSSDASWTTTIGNLGSSWQYTWQAHPAGFPAGFFLAGDFRVIAIVEQTLGSQTCTYQTSIRVSLQD